MDALQHACETLASQGIETVAKRYDSGPNALAYHNSSHTRDVVSSAQTLSELARDRLSPTDKALLLPAAGWHDAVHGRKDGKNEELSALEAARAMWDSSYDFTKEQVERVGGLIMSTVTTVKDGVIMQAVDEDDYATMLLADADLSSLGMEPDESVPRITQYFKEVVGIAPKVNGAFMNFLLGEESLLQKHVFHTEEAQKAFSHVQENALAVRSLMRRYCVQ